MDIKFVEGNIWGERRYIHQLENGNIVYITFAERENMAEASFVVGIAGGKSDMTGAESHKYRLGIQGDIITNIGEHPYFVNVEFTNNHENFADFYSEDGQIIKSLLIKYSKIFKKDGVAYYEVKSDKKEPGKESVETFIENREAHKCELTEPIEKKEMYAKLFMTIFNELLK